MSLAVTIPPHGGELVDRVLRGKAREEAFRRASSLPRIALNARTMSDLELISVAKEDPVAAINQKTHDLLRSGGESLLWDLLSSRNVFESQPARLERWLDLTRSRRVVFGHRPHRSSRPEIYHGGKAINFDGGLSRSHRLHQRGSALAASVGPLSD